MELSVWGSKRFHPIKAITTEISYKVALQGSLRFCHIPLNLVLFPCNMLVLEPLLHYTLHLISVVPEKLFVNSIFKVFWKGQHCQHTVLVGLYVPKRTIDVLLTIKVWSKIISLSKMCKFCSFSLYQHHFLYPPFSS